ncbi:hypothetical protein KAF25_001390 [Fusarium avenaceum]|uniref:Uncharacterized protein n=1 Tax=Fusarium avenaceum TaxID=40199 RepID=A0A9P7H7X5_9HYPO|nr:hypothetical protein KAF25_001390 [Fusarium avenaceum]
MDDDRWLEYPNSSHPTKLIATSAEERAAVIGASEIRILRRLSIWSTTTLNMYRIGKASRATREPHLVYDLLSRACRLQQDYGHASSWKSMKKELRDSVYKELSMDSTVQFVFVGISALNCQPVVMVRDDREETGAELTSDNMKSVALKTLPELSPCTKEIIWLENMMIPGNISYVKKALWGLLAVAEKKRFLEVMKREHILLVNGLNPFGVASRLLSNEEQNRNPRFDRSIHNNDCYNYHYRLRWPPISLLEIPPAMVGALKEFLSTYPFDNVPLNIAIAAVIIFHDLRKNGMKEETFLTRDTKCSPLGRTTIAQFILYFPHMLSKQEVLYQNIGGPKTLFNKNTSNPELKVSGIPSVDYWNPGKGTKTMALTGRAREVGPIFPDYDCFDYTKKAIEPLMNSVFSSATYYRQNFPIREALTTSTRDQTSTMNNELNRIAEYFRIPPLQRQMNPETLLLDWCGIDTHLQDLIEKGDLEKVAGGELKRAASPESPTPHAKRVKIEEDELDPTILTQIMSLIDGLPAKSRGWHALEAYLKLHPIPTVRGAQDMVLCVCASICDIDNAFLTETTNDLVDDLDIFIRMSFRAAGLFDKHEVALLNYETKWAEHREAFFKFGPGIGNAIEAIYRLRGPGGFALAYPQIKYLRESSLISAQLDGYKTIEDWLEEQAAKTD